MARIEKGKTPSASSGQPAIKVEPVEIKTEPGLEPAPLPTKPTKPANPAGPTPSTSKEANVAAPAARPVEPRLNCPHITYAPNLCSQYFKTLVSASYIILIVAETY